MILLTDEERKLDILEYLYSIYFLNEKQFKIGIYCKKAFRRQKFLKTTSNYNTFRTIGGKQEKDEFFIEVINANRAWYKLEQILTIRDLSFIENHIGKLKLMNEYENLKYKDFEKLCNRMEGILSYLLEKNV